MAITGWKEAHRVDVVDVSGRRIVREMESGRDPEELDVTADGRRVWVSNEDVSGVSEIDVDSGAV